MPKNRKKKDVRKKEFSLREEYAASWNFIKDSREFMYIAIIGFAIFVVIGFFFEDVVNVIFKSLLGFDLRTNIITFLKSLVGKTDGMSQTQIIGYLFVNNLKSSFSGMIFGIFFGLFSAFSLITNGYLLGFVAMISVREAGVLVLWRILPHGIFELPALFIALGLGMKLGSHAFRPSKNSFKESFVESLRVFLLIIVPLLIIAAIIEGSLIYFS